jgi:hypothetical protein
VHATAVAFLALLGACYDPDVRAATDDGPELADGARSVDARVTGSIDASAYLDQLCYRVYDSGTLEGTIDAYRTGFEP